MSNITECNEHTANDIGKEFLFEGKYPYTVLRYCRKLELRSSASDDVRLRFIEKFGDRATCYCTGIVDDENVREAIGQDRYFKTIADFNTWLSLPSDEQ